MADNDHSAWTSTIVAALPAEDDPINAIGPQEKHATLLFFGEIDDFTAGWINAALMALTVDRTLMPFGQGVGHIEGLGEDEPQAQVVRLLEATTLKAFRNKLLENDEVRKAWESVKQYPSFKPHITLGYGDEVTEEDKQRAVSLSEIRFDRLALWHKDKQIEFPLGYQLESMVAGAPRIVRTAEGARRFGVPIGTEIRVDDKGRVVRLDKTAPPKESGRGDSTPPRPDPDRKPQKFVATRPGQKAKIPAPGGQAGGSSSGLGGSALSAVTSWDKISDVLGAPSDAARNAIIDLNNRRSLSPAQKAALRTMIENIFRQLAKDAKPDEDKDEKKSEKSERSEAQKEATAKAQEASSESTSAAKKEAQAKAQKAASAKSAWLRSLRAAYAALGGNPKDLPNSEEAGAGKPAGGSEASASSEPKGGKGGKGAEAGSPTADFVEPDDSKLPLNGFSGMNDKELVRSIRQLIQAQKGQPNSSKIKNALRRARVVRDRRGLKKREQEAQRREFLANSGGSK